MKRKTTKEILAESFRELAESKSIDKITVQEIVNNCDYSTATFYRHFKDKYDLIAWDYANQITQMMNQVGKNGYTWRQTLLDGLRQYQKQKDYLTNLLVHTGGHDFFIRYMSETHAAQLTAHVKRLREEDYLDKETELFIRMYCLGTACLNCEWILGKIEATPEELADIYERSLPEPMRQLLTEK